MSDADLWRVFEASRRDPREIWHRGSEDLVMRLVAPLLASLVLVGCGPAQPAAAPAPAHPESEDDPAPVVADARAALSDCLRGGDFLTLFESLDESGREALAASDDTSVALQARWELERRVEVTGETPRPLDGEGIERFVAFAAERTGGAPPTWWADALRSARFHPSTGATSYQGLLELRAARIGSPVAWGARRVQAIEGVSLVADAEGALRVGAASVEVPLPADAMGTENAVDLYVLPVPPTSMIVAPLSAGIGFPYVASRWDGGAQRWTAEVCGGGRQMLAGMGAGFLEVVRRGDVALFFGAESHAVYLDALRVDDGGLVYRFNSDLWFARHHEERRAASGR